MIRLAQISPFLYYLYGNQHTVTTSNRWRIFDFQNNVTYRVQRWKMFATRGKCWGVGGYSQRA